jgi:hypothetical protein
MDKIGNFDGQRAALSIAYFSGGDCSEEDDAALGEIDQRIREAWAMKEV